MCFRQATETEEEEKETGRKPQPARTLVGVGNEKMGRDKQQTKREKEEETTYTQREQHIDYARVSFILLLFVAFLLPCQIGLRRYVPLTGAGSYKATARRGCG